MGVVFDVSRESGEGVEGESWRGRGKRRAGEGEGEGKRRGGGGGGGGGKGGGGEGGGGREEEGQGRGWYEMIWRWMRFCDVKFRRKCVCKAIG